MLRRSILNNMGWVQNPLQKNSKESKSFVISIWSILSQDSSINRKKFKTWRHTLDLIFVGFDADRAPKELNIICFLHESLLDRAIRAGTSSRNELVKKQLTPRPSRPTIYLSGATVPLIQLPLIQSCCLHNRR